MIAHCCTVLNCHCMPSRRCWGHIGHKCMVGPVAAMHTQLPAIAASLLPCCVEVCRAEVVLMAIVAAAADHHAGAVHRHIPKSASQW